MTPAQAALVNAVMGMCAGSVLLSLVLMAFALNLAYLGRRFLYGIRELA